MTRAASCSPSRASTTWSTASDQRTQTFDSPGDRPYKLDLIDPWEMTVTPSAPRRPAIHRLRAEAGPGVSLHALSARRKAAARGADHRLGHRRRAAADGASSPAPAAAGSHWDFGDGATSHESEPTHTSSRSPALLRDARRSPTPTAAARGPSCRSPWTGMPSEPIVRAGFADGTRCPR